MAAQASTRVAVVGVGALGKHHAEAWARQPDAQLVAVVDTRAERAQAVASRFECRPVARIEDLPREVEAVSLAVPTTQHAAIGCPLLERGIHLLVEKPMAATLEGADRLIEASRKGGCVLQVGHSERFNPAFLAVQEFVRQPRFFEAHRLGVFVPRSLDVDVVLDLMIHDLDLILHMVDQPVASVRAVGIPVLTPRVDIANARLEFEGGCVANVTASRVSAERIRKFRFFQAHDYVSIDFHSRQVEMYSLLGEDPPRIVERDFEVDDSDPLTLEIAAFLEAVRSRDGRGAGCSGPEGRKALALALEVLRCMSSDA